MQVNTRKFGVLEIDEKDIVTFEHGLPGFLDAHKFIMLPYEKDSPFLYLQSVEEEYLAFLMTSPFLFFDDYEFIMDEVNMNELGVKSEEDIAVYTMITVSNNETDKITANLVAPIVVNIHKRQAKQIVLERSQYQTKHRIVPADVSDKGGKS